MTFNGHRIHYDQAYVTEVEGYPGLVVHGPLQATLLFNMAAKLGGGVPAIFRYRGLSPLFAGQALVVKGRRDQDGRVTCWTETDQKTVCMEFGMRLIARLAPLVLTERPGASQKDLTRVQADGIEGPGRFRPRQAAPSVSMGP